LQPFNPLWTGCASIEQAQRVKENLKLYEYTHGVVPCEAALHNFVYQWDYPNTWPPHSFMVSEALSKYNYEKDAQRIRSKYVILFMKFLNQPVLCGRSIMLWKEM
jgi:alpha,alpha-trehalase